MSGNTKPDNRTHAQRRLAERQAALRDYMATRGYLEQIEADLDRDIAQDELAVVKYKTETRLRLLQKILPDLRQMEHTGDPDSPVQAVVRVLFGRD